MTLLLVSGTTCIADGRVLQIDGPDSITHMRARDVATGAMVTVPISRLAPLPKEVKRQGQQADVVPEAEWTRCTALSKDLLALGRSGTGADLERLARQHGCSIRTIQRARAALLREERASTLVRGKAGRPPGCTLLMPEVEALIRHAIEKHYLRRERPSKTYIVQRARSMARRLGLPPPSRKAILLRIAREEGWAADVARYGLRASKQKWEPRTGALNVDKPLDLIQIDHTPADVLLLSDDRSVCIGRPWVTVAIDVASRCVLGVYISMDAPSAVSVSLCIEHAVLPKRENEQDPSLWPMYGKPKRILVDNGKDFRSLALQRGCQEHGIELSWRPVRTPHYGGHIERLIGTLMKMVHLLPGTTFSNIKERGEYDSERRARLTLDEFRAWITQKICRNYHVQSHRGVGVPPQLAWERGLTNESGVFEAPPLMTDPLEFRMDFLPFQYRRVRRTGVELNATRYWHEDLAPMLNRPEEAMVRYDPRDPGQVWVRRADGVLVTAPAIAGRAVGAPGGKRALDKAAQAQMDQILDAGFAATDAIEQTAASCKMPARRSNSRQKNRRGKGGESASAHTDPMTLASPMMPKAGDGLVVEEWE